MTASCVAITAARLASIASSQSAKKRSGSSATPSRDNNSYTTIFRTPYTSDWSRCYQLTDQAAETHRCDVQDVGYEIRVGRRERAGAPRAAGAGREDAVIFQAVSAAVQRVCATASRASTSFGLSA